MIEIILLIYFGKKVKAIAIDRKISVSRALFYLFSSWFLAETMVFALGIQYFGKINQETLLKLMIPALFFAIISAFIVIHRLKKIPIDIDAEDDEDEPIEKSREETLKHFR